MVHTVHTCTYLRPSDTEFLECLCACAVCTRSSSLTHIRPGNEARSEPHKDVIQDLHVPHADHSVRGLKACADL